MWQKEGKEIREEKKQDFHKQNNGMDADMWYAVF